ncbi:MAG: FAD-binding protein, partial [Dehalococcoidia bacterium]
GGILRNADREQFMLNYTSEGDLAPRDVVARSIVSEMKRTGTDRVYLDVTHMQARIVSARFPQIYRFCLDHDLDITSSMIPVAPAAHYIMGGVRANYWGETNISGLFASGEVACTGVHGANRLASNSLLEVLVFGKRIVERLKRAANAAISAGEEAFSLKERDWNSSSPSVLSLTALQALLWENAGIMRSREGLQKAVNTLAAWEKELVIPTDRPSYELANMVLVGRFMTEAALMREESRGAHFRSDFPEPSDAWLRHIVYRKEP